MIVLDTHIWVWWTDENPSLAEKEAEFLRLNQNDGLGISAFSVWEVAKLYEKHRINFSVSIEEWLNKALTRPNIVLLPITPSIIIESIKLPGEFHQDPADQIIVATARSHDAVLVTYDGKILEYEHVRHMS